MAEDRFTTQFESAELPRLAGQLLAEARRCEQVQQDPGETGRTRRLNELSIALQGVLHTFIKEAGPSDADLAMALATALASIVLKDWDHKRRVKLLVQIAEWALSTADLQDTCEPRLGRTIGHA